LTSLISDYPAGHHNPARNASEWVQQRLGDAQLLPWRKACKECHALTYPNGAGAVPETTKAGVTARWMQHASFDHEAHQMVACVPCHVKTGNSQETSDVLIPGIQTCRDCHRGGSHAAEARCFECHTYHDWSTEKRVNGNFTVRQLTE